MTVTFYEPGLPHHVTQRGERRQDVFFLDEDRDVYLDLLQENLMIMKRYKRLAAVFRNIFFTDRTAL